MVQPIPRRVRPTPGRGRCGLQCDHKPWKCWIEQHQFRQHWFKHGLRRHWVWQYQQYALSIDDFAGQLRVTVNGSWARRLRRRDGLGDVSIQAEGHRRDRGENAALCTLGFQAHTHDRTCQAPHLGVEGTRVARNGRAA